MEENVRVQAYLDKKRTAEPQGSSSTGPVSPDSSTRIGSSKEDAIGLGPEEKVEAFKALLRETQINPFGTWEKELAKFAHDPRYTLVANLSQRRAIFNDVCKELAFAAHLGKNKD